eukprot:TRINITY_DN19989_c0_g1_i1.p1 TRINITY_DN19989_c0_g1~~TRINITY_DN19989_c0_g1_i1.p1  ORF type:complete len:846 (+),score=210.71 TRINITY_DN19989_c0_g1_i1:74-2539(+)
MADADARSTAVAVTQAAPPGKAKAARAMDTALLTQKYEEIDVQARRGMGGRLVAGAIRPPRSTDEYSRFWPSFGESSETAARKQRGRAHFATATFSMSGMQSSAGDMAPSRPQTEGGPRPPPGSPPRRRPSTVGAAPTGVMAAPEPLPWWKQAFRNKEETDSFSSSVVQSTVRRAVNAGRHALRELQQRRMRSTPGKAERSTRSAKRLERMRKQRAAEWGGGAAGEPGDCDVPNITQMHPAPFRSVLGAGKRSRNFGEPDPVPQARDAPAMIDGWRLRPDPAWLPAGRVECVRVEPVTEPAQAAASPTKEAQPGGSPPPPSGLVGLTPQSAAAADLFADLMSPRSRSEPPTSQLQASATPDLGPSEAPAAAAAAPAGGLGAFAAVVSAATKAAASTPRDEFPLASASEAAATTPTAGPHSPLDREDARRAYGSERAAVGPPQQRRSRVSLVSVASGRRSLHRVSSAPRPRRESTFPDVREPSSPRHQGLPAARSAESGLMDYQRVRSDTTILDQEDDRETDPQGASVVASPPRRVSVYCPNAPAPGGGGHAPFARRGSLRNSIDQVRMLQQARRRSSMVREQLLVRLPKWVTDISQAEFQALETQFLKLTGGRHTVKAEDVAHPPALHQLGQPPKPHSIGGLYITPDAVRGADRYGNGRVPFIDVAAQLWPQIPERRWQELLERASQFNTATDVNLRFPSPVLDEIRAVFNLYDSEGKGYITAQQVHEHLRNGDLNQDEVTRLCREAYQDAPRRGSFAAASNDPSDVRLNLSDFAELMKHSYRPYRFEKGSMSQPKVQKQSLMSVFYDSWKLQPRVGRDES